VMEAIARTNRAAASDDTEDSDALCRDLTPRVRLSVVGSVDLLTRPAILCLTAGESHP